MIRCSVCNCLLQEYRKGIDRDYYYTCPGCYAVFVPIKENGLPKLVILTHYEMIELLHNRLKEALAGGGE